MKHRTFNLQRVIRAPKVREEQVEEPSTSSSEPFQQFFSMFKTFFNQNSSRKHSQIFKSPQFELEARDREVAIDLPPLTPQGKLEASDLRWWVTQVVKTTFSAAFNAFSKGQMSFDQAKIYCSENFFKNIVRLNQVCPLSQGQFEMVDKHIKEGVLPYMATKYPLTESTQVNKKLYEVVHEVDHIETVDNNYFTTSSIIFELRESGNYNDLIMRVINDQISKVDQSQEPNNYRLFEMYISDLFELVEDEEWMATDGQLREAASLQSDMMLSRGHAKEAMKKEKEAKENYRAKVKEYTNYLIGRKISENTPLYSEDQILNERIELKSPQIVRILSKWCQELEEKYKNLYFSVRSEQVRLQRDDVFMNLLPWMRQQIDDDLMREKRTIDSSMAKLFSNNYQMQANILRYQLDHKGDEHIDTVEKISGKLSCKIVNNLHEYILTYLNQLIHGILKATKKLHQQLDPITWPSPPCLLSFKMGDLLRCKCSSRQREIIRIYEEINRISREQPELLKIVRIKNRLKSGTNDILMNVRFNSSILCEIQLAIDSTTTSFTQSSNKFHHYLYQLQRSLFGPVTEMSSIWSALDRRMHIYQQLVEQQFFETRERAQHQCSPNEGAMVPYTESFICSSCKLTYSHNRYLRDHLKCKVCSFLLCARCIIDKESAASLLGKQNADIVEVCGNRIEKDAKLPDFGICVLIQTEEPKPIPFTLINFQSHDYLLKKEDGRISEITNITTKKGKNSFKKNHLIFNLKKNDRFQPIAQKEALNKYILPLFMKDNFKKEKVTISLMDLKLTTEQCQEILSVVPGQKPYVKNIFATDNAIKTLPWSPIQFPNLQWLTLSRNSQIFIKGVEQFSHLRKLILTNCKLQTVSQIYECRNLTQIILSYNPIKTIDEKIANFCELKTLALCRCSLKQLPPAFFECRKLVSLDISENSLTELTNDFEKFADLELLSAMSNSLKVVGEGIGKLKKLRFLRISTNYNLKQNIWLGENSNLEMLRIGSTGVTDIFPPKDGFPNLKEVWLQNAPIKSLSMLENCKKIVTADLSGVPAEALLNFPVENISYLLLTDNKTPNVFQFIGKMKKLTRINFSRNTIPDAIPPALNFKLLREINLQNCKVTSLPDLSACMRLVKLQAPNNKIPSIPETFFQSLVNMQELNISYNELVSLPHSILKLHKLKVLKVNNNKLTSFFLPESEAKTDLKKSVFPLLKTAQINNNQLTHFPIVLYNCPNMQSLSAYSNKITYILPEISLLSKLKKLYLAFNMLTEIPEQIQFMTELEQLTINKNLFTTLPRFLQTFEKMKKLNADCDSILSVECADWIFSSQSVAFDGIKKTVTKIKEEAEKAARAAEEAKKAAEELVKTEEASAAAQPEEIKKQLEGTPV